MSGAAGVLAEARTGLRAAQGGDADAAARVHRLLLDLQGALETAESELDWPAFEAEVDDDVAKALSWVAALGTTAEREICERTLKALEEARQGRERGIMDRQVRVLRTLAESAYARDPRSASWNFNWYQGQMTEATDPVRFQALVDEGRRALAKGDDGALRRINRQLFELFPGTAEERALSFGSGVR